MTAQPEAPRVVSASREIVAGAGRIFGLIADPAQQPRWDGNDNLAMAPGGQRVRRAGDVFTMTLTKGSIRENHVVEFEEGRRLAWMPAEAGKRPPGHLWRWELEPIGISRPTSSQGCGGKGGIMMTESDSAVAVYWDFENVHACLMDDLEGPGAYRRAWFRSQEPLVDIDPVVEYAATLGRIVVHRAYCNWQYYGRYRDELQAHAVALVQLFPLTGSKNGADIRLVLDVADDLQRHPHLTHVVLVASDSDYTSLAQQCRSHGRFFIGVGTTRTASSYKFACDEFRLYRDLAAASASPAAAETEEAAQELAPLEDAAELVVKAVRMLAAGRGESWALKAAVRPLVKRLDPAFEERNFGYATFTELLKALDGSIVERAGEYDHELAVRADIDGQLRPSSGGAVASSTPAVLVERQLRRRGLRLPTERRIMWAVPQLIVDAFGASATTIEPSFESLRLKLEPSVSALGFVLSDVDFNKLKGILWRGHVFEVHGHGNGISLRVPNLEQLRYRLVTVLLENLADPADEDPALLAEAFFGPSPTGEQNQLVSQALRALLEGRNEIETAGA